MSAPRPNRLDLSNDETGLAADIAALVDAAIEERIGRAISKSTGNVRADAVDGILPPRSGGTGTNEGVRPHELTGDRHTMSGLTVGHVLTATSATAAAFAAPTGDSGGYYEPVTNGDPDFPELVYDDSGDVVVGWVDLP